MAQKKEKVLVLGGGLGGCVAAAALTDPKQNDKYDVTLHTMGWRLGGKGASGRNPHKGERIEEHGLHIWFGCYDNAFILMRQIYEELDRPKDAPLATLKDAFHKQNVFVLQEKVGDKWVPWEIDFPEFNIKPGGHPSTWAFIEIIMAWAYRALKYAFGGTLYTEHPHEIKHEGWLGRLANDVEHGFAEAGAEFTHATDSLLSHLFHHEHDDEAREKAAADAFAAGASATHVAEGVHAALKGKSRKEVHASWGARGMAHLIKIACEKAWEELSPKIPEDDNARRGWIMFYLGATISRGILLDDLEHNGVDSINAIEGRAWLRKHAALPDDAPKNPNDIAINSAPLQALYDAAFAYKDGNNDTPNFSAATMLRGCLWLPFSYKGSFCYEMQAGMGDTVFTPFYQALKARGVKFEYFSQVTDVQADAAGQKVESVKIQKQVELSVSEYNPLVDVEGLACWPSKPLYDQIKDGETLKKANVNLEHYSSGWKNVGDEVTLTAGEDFDHVVLAIPLPAHEQVCASLADSRPAWKAAMDNVQATRTCAVQLWFEDTREQLSYDFPPAVNGSFVEPWSSLADFTHLLPKEDWGEENVHYLLYTCGVFPFDVASTQGEAHEWVVASIDGFMQNDIETLLPKTAKPGGGFNYGTLFDPNAGIGKERLMAQYIRANIDANELYILSTAEGIDYRPKVQAADLSNLYFSGDWTNNGFNISAVEGAVMSGLQASRAISGYPQDIVGEDPGSLSPSS